MTDTLAASPKAVGVYEVLDAAMVQLVDSAKAYHESFIQCGKQQACYAFLAGMRLTAIKDSVKHGQFTAFRETHCPEIPARTATRYMALYSKLATVADLPTVGNLKLLSNGQLPEKEEQKIVKAFHENTGGKELTQLYRETGIIREAAPVGRRPGEGGRKRISLAEQAKLLKAQAVDDWKTINRSISVYRHKFTVLTDHDVEGQISTLEQALKARKAWLKQPFNARDPKAIETIFS